RSSGVTLKANGCPLQVSATAPRSRSSEPPMAGWSGGYRAQLRAVATKVRARAETLRETSGERVVASAISEGKAHVNYTLGRPCAPSISFAPNGMEASWTA